MLRTRSRLATLATLLAATGCTSRTDVIVAPHASPFGTDAGIVKNIQAFGADNFRVGVTAVNDGHRDVSWEIRKAGRQLWACRGREDATCRPAHFAEGTYPSEDIRLLALPVADTWITSQAQGPDAKGEAPVPVAIPNHGVWATALRKGLTYGLYHCTLEEDRPVCRLARESFLPANGLSRHIIVEGDQHIDVVWVGGSFGFFSNERCERRDERPTCDAVVFE